MGTRSSICSWRRGRCRRNKPSRPRSGPPSGPLERGQDNVRGLRSAGGGGGGFTLSNAVASVEIGIGEVAATGDHICALYSGPVERDAILLPFLRSALRSGDKCVCVIDSTEPADLLTDLGLDTGIDLAACLASRQFDLVRAVDTTMRSGRFCPADMVGFWKASVAGVMNAGRYQRLRAASETGLSLRDLPEWREVVQHESEINRLLSLYPQVLLCLYDLEKLGGAFLVDLMSMHPRLLINRRLTENSYYLEPDEWLARGSRRTRLSPAARGGAGCGSGG